MIFHQLGNSGGVYKFNLAFYQNVDWYAHFHKNYELIYVSAGRLKTQIDDECATMLADDWALVLPNQVHSFTCEGETSFRVAVFSEDFVPLFSADIGTKQAKSPFFRCKDTVRTMILSELTEQASLILKKACLYAACEQYLRGAELVERKIKPGFIAGSVVDYIAKNYRDDISLKKCAEALGYEYHYLSRLLNSTYNINFRKTLNGYRVDAAVELLRTSDMPIIEIAFKSGFQSVRSFNLIIKEMYGVPPHALRNGAGNGMHRFGLLPEESGYRKKDCKEIQNMV